MTDITGSNSVYSRYRYDFEPPSPRLPKLELLVTIPTKTRSHQSVALARMVESR
jgi:hypothetical protein